MNKFLMIGFFGGFSTIICLLYYNKTTDINKKVKFNKEVDIIDGGCIKDIVEDIIYDNIDEGKLDYDRYRLIIYRKPIPIYDLYIKNEWEIL